MPKNWQMKLGGVALCLLMCAGCALFLIGAGAAVGVGAYKWVEGTLDRDYPRPMQPTFNACLTAARTLNIRITGQQYGNLESRIEGVQGTDTGVKVQLEQKPNNITTVKVRFGIMGNKDASTRFHDQVEKALGLTPG